MAQTDDAISMALSSVEMSTDFSSWDDISGFAVRSPGAAALASTDPTIPQGPTPPA